MCLYALCCLYNILSSAFSLLDLVLLLVIGLFFIASFVLSHQFRTEPLVAQCLMHSIIKDDM